MDSVATYGAKERRAALVLGNYRQTLAVMRSLSAMGYRVVVGYDGAGSAAEWSRYADEVWPHPPVGRLSQEEFARQVGELLHDRPDIGVVFPVGDDEIVPLSRHRARLPDLVTLVMPSAQVVEACLDKPSSLQLAADVGFPIAPYKVIRDATELPAAFEEVGYPCVVKTLNELTRAWGRKAVIVDGSNALAELLADPEAPREPLIVQRRVTGARYNYNFAAYRGELLAGVLMQAVRTDRVDGTGYTTEGISVAPREDLVAACRRMVARLDYTGVGSAQAMADADGQLATFLELNARLDANAGFTRYCGLDLPRMAVELAAGRRPSVPETGQLRIGKRFGWLIGDLGGIRDGWKSGDIGAGQAMTWLAHMGVSAMRCHTHLTWSWRDPRPALALYSRLVTGPLRKVLLTTRHDTVHAPPAPGGSSTSMPPATL